MLLPLLLPMIVLRVNCHNIILIELLYVRLPRKAHTSPATTRVILRAIWQSQPAAPTKIRT
jgi:hypothetical protein